MGLKRNVTFSFLWNIVLMGVNFINNMLLSRILIPEQRGEYVFFISNATLLTAILSVGLFSSIVYFGSSQKVNINKLFFSLAFFYLGILLLVKIISHFGYHFLQIDLLFPSSHIFNLLLLNTAITIFISLQSSFLLSKQEISLFNITQLISPSLMGILFLLIMFDIIKNYDVDYLISLYTGTLFIALIVVSLFVYIRKIISFSFSFLSLDQLKVVVFFGLFNFASDLIQFCNYRIDYWFVKFYISNEALGVYSMSGVLSQLIWILPSAISTILFPFVASLSENENKHKNEILILSKAVFYICLLGAVVAGIFMYIFIPVFFGDSYTSVTFYYYILIIGTVPYTYSKLYASVIAGMNKISINFKASLYGLLVTLLLNFMLIPHYGILGACIASIFSYTTSTFVILSYISSTWNISIFNLVFLNLTEFKFIKDKVNQKIFKCIY